MKTSTAAFLSVLFVCVAVGEETRSSSPVPQPRVRLDPVTRAAVVVPQNETGNASDVPIMLDRFVVKDRRELPIQRPTVEDPAGEFSPLKGGRLLRRDVGGVRVEVGLWPWIELFEKESRFKDSRTHVKMDFLRIKW